MPSLKSLEDHGLEVVGESGDQLICHCPFCGGTRKFYLHAERLVWDCKVCGVSGNADQYLDVIANESAEDMRNIDWRKLALNWGLPVKALKKWSIGRNGKGYLLPVRSPKGTVTDIRKIVLGRRTMATPGCSTGLLGAQRMPNDKKTPIYLCEGEKDPVAMQYILDEAGRPGVALGVPGANTFKREWIAWFQGRNVVVCYDNDKGGDEGSEKVFKLLKGVAKSCRVIHWPEGTPDKFDIRDFYKKHKTKGCEWILKQLDRMLRIKPRSQGSEPDKADAAPADEPDEYPPLSPQEMKAVFRKWLSFDDASVLDVLFGVHFANLIDRSSPVWMYLPGDSGGGKSEILNAFRLAKGVYTLTNLTPHALVSGAVMSGGDDPSLLPRLDGHTLVIKDFTAILSMPAVVREEIFGTLRDAYDGRFSKEFGTGQRRHYEAHFGIIAGVTKVIDSGGFGAELGERFLKFRLPQLTEAQQRDITLAAMAGAAVGEKRSQALAEAVAGCFAWERDFENIPQLTPDQVETFFALARYVAMMRRTIPTTFGNEPLGSVIEEVPTRIAVQLQKLAQGIAIHLGEPHITNYIMGLIIKVAMDTPAPRRTRVIQAIHESPGGLTRSEIQDQVQMPKSTAYVAVEQFETLGLLRKADSGRRGAAKYVLNKTLQQCLDTIRSK